MTRHAYIFYKMEETSDVSFVKDIKFNLKEKYYVYVLVSYKDKSWYIGFTADLRKRLIAHARGEVISTKFKKPWKMVHYEYFVNQVDAKARERFLKSGYGRQQLKAMMKNTFL